jgi:hypothetical protein
VQPQLPHIICGNKKVLPLHVQRHVQQHLLQNVFVIRRQSAWINTDLMVKVMGVLGHVLRRDETTSIAVGCVVGPHCTTGFPSGRQGRHLVGGHSGQADIPVAACRHPRFLQIQNVFAKKVFGSVLGCR